MFLMSEMQENKQLSDIDLGALRTQGYTQSEITDAFAWLYDVFQEGYPSPGRPAEASRGSRRILHEAEKLMFSTESQGYLIQLAELGLLDDRDIEIVIERAMIGGYERLSVAELRRDRGVRALRQAPGRARHRLHARAAKTRFIDGRCDRNGDKRRQSVPESTDEPAVKAKRSRRRQVTPAEAEREIPHHRGIAGQGQNHQQVPRQGLRGRGVGRTHQESPEEQDRHRRRSGASSPSTRPSRGRTR